MLGKEIETPIFIEDDHLQYHLNAVNQLQLFGNSAPMDCNVDPTNYFVNDQNISMLRPNKRGREGENISRLQKLQNSSSYHVETDRVGGIPNQDYVSTGLRLKLSYDDDERKSSGTSSSGSMVNTPPFIMSLGGNIRIELDRQKEELDHYIKSQERILVKGMMEITQKQTARFLSALEKGVIKKVQEKDLEIENINRKNMELENRIQKSMTEAQWWHNKAKYNESKISILKNHLQQAILNGADHGKEGYGDSEFDDVASYVDQNNNHGNFPNIIGKEQHAIRHSMMCKVCKGKEVSVLLMPCRHLCLCKDCDVQMLICPVCQFEKTASVDVYIP